MLCTMAVAVADAQPLLNAACLPRIDASASAESIADIAVFNEEGVADVDDVEEGIVLSVPTPPDSEDTLGGKEPFLSFLLALTSCVGCLVTTFASTSARNLGNVDGLLPLSSACKLGLEATYIILSRPPSSCWKQENSFRERKNVEVLFSFSISALH